MKIGDKVKSTYYGQEVFVVRDIIPNEDTNYGKFAYVLSGSVGIHYRHELTLIETGPDEKLKEAFNTISQKWRIIDQNTMLFVTFDDFKKELKGIL